MQTRGNKVINFTLEEIPEVADVFLQNIGSDKVFLFDGEMGVGKTTLISEICRRLGSGDDFGSPTFSIVNEYIDREGNAVYHFDFYRLDSPEEAYDIGVEDLFYSGNLCLIEWPDKIKGLYPENARSVKISLNTDGSRRIEF